MASTRPKADTAGLGFVNPGWIKALMRAAEAAAWPKSVEIVGEKKKNNQNPKIHIFALFSSSLAASIQCL